MFPSVTQVVQAWAISHRANQRFRYRGVGAGICTGSNPSHPFATDAETGLYPSRPSPTHLWLQERLTKCSTIYPTLPADFALPLFRR